MVYITTEVAKTVVSLLRGFTTLPPRTHVTLESHLFFFKTNLRKTNNQTNTNDKHNETNTQQQQQ